MGRSYANEARQLMSNVDVLVSLSKEVKLAPIPQRVYTNKGVSDLCKYLDIQWHPSWKTSAVSRRRSATIAFDVVHGRTRASAHSFDVVLIETNVDMEVILSMSFRTETSRLYVEESVYSLTANMSLFVGKLLYEYINKLPMMHKFNLMPILTETESHYNIRLKLGAPRKLNANHVGIKKVELWEESS